MKYSNNSKLENDLIVKLKEIVGDPETIFGIMVYADNDRDRQAILNFINAGDDVDIETISVLAIELYNAKNR